MANYALINKEVIPYICSKKKVSIDYLVKKTGLKQEKIEGLFDLSNESKITINQAKTIAKCLHVPFAGLYMNKEDVRIKEIPSFRNFRTFDGAIVVDDSGINIAICDVLLKRDFLLSERNDMGLSMPHFTHFEFIPSSPVELAQFIRLKFSVDIREQFKCNSTRQFYLYLRDKIEQMGIFIQCFNDVSIDVARGFSIYDKELPVIGINSDDRPPAKSFSIIHELVHLLKRESSLCNSMYNKRTTQAEEVFCNAVAGEVLVPNNELQNTIEKYGFSNSFTKENIGTIANRFSVSREVIIRRLFDTHRITEKEYNSFSDAFKHELEIEKEERELARKEGNAVIIPRNISREAIDSTSPTICKTLYYGYGEEVYSKLDVAHYLNISPKHIDKFLKEVEKWNN